MLRNYYPSENNTPKFQCISLHTNLFAAKKRQSTVNTGINLGIQDHRNHQKKKTMRTKSKNSGHLIGN